MYYKDFIRKKQNKKQLVKFLCRVFNLSKTISNFNFEQLVYFF